MSIQTEKTFFGKLNMLPKMSLKRCHIIYCKFSIPFEIVPSSFASFSHAITYIYEREKLKYILKKDRCRPKFILIIISCHAPLWALLFGNNIFVWFLFSVWVCNGEGRCVFNSFCYQWFVSGLHSGCLHCSLGCSWI